MLWMSLGKPILAKRTQTNINGSLIQSNISTEGLREQTNKSFKTFLRQLCWCNSLCVCGRVSCPMFFSDSWIPSSCKTESIRMFQMSWSEIGPPHDKFTWNLYDGGMVCLRSYRCAGLSAWCIRMRMYDREFHYDRNKQSSLDTRYGLDETKPNCWNLKSKVRCTDSNTAGMDYSARENCRGN